MADVDKQLSFSRPPQVSARQPRHLPISLSRKKVETVCGIGNDSKTRGGIILCDYRRPWEKHLWERAQQMMQMVENASGDK
jgi:hypothetical protein